MKNNDCTFYHGTTKQLNVGDYLTYSSITHNKNMGTYNYHKNYRVRVTKDIESAVYYAKKSAEEKQCTPFVYVVEPDKLSLVQKSKFDYVTSNAKIIEIVDLENLPADE